MSLVPVLTINVLTRVVIYIYKVKVWMCLSKVSIYKLLFR